MLPAAYRLTEAEGFRRVVRSGRRVGSRTIVVHILAELPREISSRGPGPQVGFVVSKAVGNAVVRNRVQRRLRHLVREHLTVLPDSGALVVRALPAAAAASSAELGADLARCLERGLERGPERAVTS